MIPPTVGRVPQYTASHLNEQIRRQAEQHVARFAADPAAIDRRLAELDREWDVERTLEANAAGISLIGLALGATVGRRARSSVAGASARRRRSTGSGMHARRCVALFATSRLPKRAAQAMAFNKRCQP